MKDLRPAEPSDGSRSLILFGFVLTGIVTVQLGPLLPHLAAKWDLNDAQAGYLFSAQFLASMLGVGLTSWLLPRFGFRTPLAVAYALMAIGAGALTLGPFTVGIAAISCWGAGIGVGIPASNLWMGTIARERRAAALSLLNAAWGAGAVLCAPLLALAIRIRSAELFLTGLAGLLVLTALAFLRTAPGSAAPTPAADSVLAAHPAKASIQTYLALGLLFFLYVGTENSIGGWITVYTKRIGAHELFSTLAPSFFWLVLLIGRIAAPLVLTRLGEMRVAFGGLMLASLGTIVLLAGHELRGVIVGTCLAGFGLSPVYPITIASLSRLGPQGNRASGPMFALAGLGGATLPALVGLFSVHYGLHTGLMIPATGTLAMMVLYGSAVEWRTAE